MMERIVQSIDVNVPVHLAYVHLSRFEQYPRFLEDVENVHYNEDGSLRWHIRAGSLGRQWDAEIEEQVPDRCIALRSSNAGNARAIIEMAEQRGGGTTVCVTLEDVPESLLVNVNKSNAAMLAERLERDLVRFKKYIEKIARDTGEWSGREEEASPSHSARDEQIAGGNDDAGQSVA